MMEMRGMRYAALDRHRCLKLHLVTVQSQVPSQLRGQAQAPFVALKVRLALAVKLLFHAPAKARLRCRSKCEVLTEHLPHLHMILFLVCLFFGPMWTVPASEPAGMTALHDALRTYLDELPGSWSVYVKNLNTDELFSLNNDRSFSAASLIKPFAMEVVCTHREEVLSRMAAREWLEPDDPALAGELEMLLENMITYSDNDAFNELVCLLSDTGDFMDGAGVMNDELRKLGYKSTSVDHTLAPSYFEPEGTGDNMTCASDCGRLLEKVCGGTFVDEQVSEEMMELLRMQDTRTKIPAGLPAYAQCANKTGETSTVQHDMAVIRGRTAWYVLCVLSGDCPEEEAVDQIREIAGLTFTYLDTDEYTRGS